MSGSVTRGSGTVACVNACQGSARAGPRSVALARGIHPVSEFWTLAPLPAADGSVSGATATPGQSRPHAHRVAPPAKLCGHYVQTNFRMIRQATGPAAWAWLADCAHTRGVPRVCRGRARGESQRAKPRARPAVDKCITLRSPPEHRRKRH